MVGILLALCYRLRPDVLSTVQPTTLAATIAAARKYCMRSLLPDLQAEWTTVSREEPLCSYLAAANRWLTDCAAEAAREMLNVQLDGCYDSEMETTPAVRYYRLVSYYESCRAVAKELLAALPLEPSDAQKTLGDRKCTGRPLLESSTSFPPPQAEALWLKETLQRYAAAADKGPGGVASTCDTIYESAVEAELWCPSCQHLAAKLNHLSRTLKEVQTRNILGEYAVRHPSDRD